MSYHKFEKGNRVFFTQEDGSSIPVKITALKKQSIESMSRGWAPQYNVKLIGTKKQLINVPEDYLTAQKQIPIWDETHAITYFGNTNGGRRKTRKARKTRKVRKSRNKTRKA